MKELADSQPRHIADTRRHESHRSHQAILGPLGRRATTRLQSSLRSWERPSRTPLYRYALSANCYSTYMRGELALF